LKNDGTTAEELSANSGTAALILAQGAIDRNNGLALQ